jgi:hypothetical protein
MSKNALEPVGDNATLSYSLSGTLSTGTLTSGTWAGNLSGTITAVGTLTPLSGIYDITPNALAIKEVDTTKIDSLAALSQPGTPDYGEVTLTVGYDNALTTLVNGWVAAKQVLFFAPTVDDFSVADSKESFLGWVKGWTPLSEELKKDEPAKAKLTIKITGVANFTAGN